MPADTDVAVADPDGIDSNCHANPKDAEAAVDLMCGEDAVTFVFKPAGHRVYLCRDHAEDLNRFDDDDAFDGPNPTAVVCKRCLRFTPRHRVSVDRICDECQTET